MKKRLSICLLTVLLLVSSAISAHATESHPKTVITTEAQLPVIEVSVPNQADVIINPLRLPVKIGADIVYSQIVSTPSYIQNMSEVPVLVSAQTTGIIRTGSDMGLFPSSVAGEDLIIKRAFLYFEMQAVNSPGSVTWASEYDEDQHIVIRTSTSRSREMVILGAAGQDKSYGAFHLAGDCVESPRSAWTENDGVDVEIAFTFKALPVDTEIP